MRGTHLLGFLLVLPPLAALGHDLYVAYGGEEGIDINKPFKFSELGWLWKEYSVETLESVRSSFDPATWTAYIVPVLKTEAVIATAVPAAIFFAIMLAMKIVRSGKFAMLAASKGNKGGFAHEPDKKAAPLKYRRK